MNTDVFEVATKQKFRFTTSRGQIGVEDLWDLKLEDLDNIAKGINKQLKESSGEESFITKKTTVDKKLSNKLAVVVSIINTKLEEQEKSRLASERKAKRTQLLELISQKENDALSKKSVNALRAEYEKLELEEESVGS